MITERDRLALLHVTKLINPTYPKTIAAYEYADAVLGGDPPPLGNPDSIDLVLLNGPGPFPIDDSIPAQFKATLRGSDGLPVGAGFTIDFSSTPGGALSVTQGITDANGEITSELTSLGASGAITMKTSYTFTLAGQYQDEVVVNFS